MIIKSIKPHEIKESQVTPEAIYKERRKFINTSATLALGMMGLASAKETPTLSAESDAAKNFNAKSKDSLFYTQNPNYKESTITPYTKATSFNNFYELYVHLEISFFERKLKPFIK